MGRIGFPVVISAASGTGKTTLSRMLLEADPDLALSISHTTRSPRGEERDGKDYHFVTEAEFKRMATQNEFIEWAVVHGNYYGSSQTSLEQQLAEEKDVMFDIDVQGGYQIRKAFPEACLIFLLPPTMDELQKRLIARGTDDPSVVARRMEASRAEIRAGLEHYDYVLTNDKLERAIFDLMSIVRAHRLRAINRDKIKIRLGIDATSELL